MAKTRLVKNSKGQYGIYNPYTDEVTPITSDMSLVKNTKGKYGFKSGNEIIELDEKPKAVNLEETFKKKVDTGLSSATSSTDSTSDYYQSAGAKAPEIEQEDPKKQLAARDQAKQEENQRYIDVFGLGRLDYSGLQKFGSLGEVAADVLDVPANLSKAFVRGVSSGRVNQAILDYAKEGGNLDSDMIARLVKENATKTGSVYLDALQKKGILQTDDMSAAGGIAEVILESMGSMAGAYKAGFQGAVAGGSAGMATGAVAGAIGGPIGSLIAGSVSTTGGAIAGFSGMTSYANEYGGSIIQSLTNKGYDLTDAKQVEAGLKNKAVMDGAKEIANQRGLIIGGVDAMTAGIAGKSAKIAVSIAKRSAAQAGKELTKAGVKRLAGGVALGIESVGGSIGEAAAQLNAEGKITDMDAVALEGIAEIGNAGPTGLYAAYKAGQINSDLNQGNLTKIEELKKAKEALPDENEATKKALDNKISALEKENKERNKSMTSALQVAPVPATKRVLELTDAITDIESTLEAIKDGTRTDISQEARKAMWDSLNDMIAERDEIRQEMLKASENEAAANIAPEKPMKPVIFIGENKEKVDNNNATVMSPNKPLEVVKVDEPITFAEKISDEKGAKPGIAYNVSQGDNIFGTIVESTNNGEKEFVLAETGKKYSSLDDAKFALQEKLTGERVSEKERVGIDRVKVEGNLANKQIFVGDPANNNQLGLEAKGAIQRAVRAMRSVSNSNVYLYSNTADYEKGIAHASGGDTKSITSGTNAQVVDANGENSIHINLEMADGTTISHEVFHGALLGLAKKDPNAFITMRDKILDRISEKQNLSVTDETGNKRKVSAKEYLMDFQKRYEGPQYTEADRAEEFLSELAGLMSLEDSTVVNDKSLLDSIKLTIKDVLKKFNVEFDSLNELQETEDMVQFFKDFNRSVKTGESINLGKVEGVKGTAAQPTAQAAPAATQNIAVVAPVKTAPKGTLTKFSILGEDNKFRPENANPKDNNVYYGVDEEGDVFMIAPESKLPRMIYDFRSYIGRLYNVTVPKGVRLTDGKGVSITELPKVDSQGNLIKKGKLAYTDTQTIKYDIKQETPVEIATATQAAPATQPSAQASSGLKTLPDGTKESAPIQNKDGDESSYMKLSVLRSGETVIEPLYKPMVNSEFYVEGKGSLGSVNITGKNKFGLSNQDFNSSYGADIDKIIADQNRKIESKYKGKRARVVGASIKAEVIKPDGSKQVLLQFSVNNSATRKKGGDIIQYYPEEFIDVPKLRYTNEFTGISTAQPEAGAVKESTTTRPEGAQKKESAAKVISRATDKAKPSVKVKAEPKPGKKTVGNTKPISERVSKVDGVMGQALAIEPTSPRDMALQYFIRGGRVVRGNTTDGAKPQPHTLVTLFSKSRAGFYYSSNKEMSQRTGLTNNETGLTITEIAHKLWEGKENESFQFDESDFRDAVESVLLDHISRAGMAKELVETKGSPAQRALISGDAMFDGMDDYEIMTHQHAAEELGISVEELLANPDKYISQEKLDGMYDDMLSAFEILDQIQDEESIKQYLEISKPEDLFLDELVAAAAKPEKTLEAQKAELTVKQKSIKKELAAAKKAKEALVNIGQTSLIDGTQTNLYPPNTLQAVEKVRDLTGQLQDINDRLAKVNSAIEFKERKTIDAFADVVEQKAEESNIPIAPANEEDKPQWLKDQEAEYALRDKEDLELMKLDNEVFRAKQRIAGDRNTENAIKDYNETKAKRDAYEESINARRQGVEDARDLQSLIDDEIYDSAQPKYEFAEEFKKDPLLAAYKRAQEMVAFLSSEDYEDYRVKDGYMTEEEASKDLERSIANYERHMSLIENAIMKQSLAEQAAKAETAPAETFFKKKPNSSAMVVDVEKIKIEKPLAYEFLSKYSNFKDFDENGIRNSLAIAYNKMMKFRAGAENLLAQISELEDIAETTAAKNTTTKDKFKADAKSSGDFNDAQLAILNEVVDSLNTELMPEYNSSNSSLNHIGVDAGEHPNFYIFQENILSSKDPAAFIHEVGHFAFYNILSKQDRLEFLNGMIESTYGNKGKSLSSRIAMTSEKAVYQDAFRKIEYGTNVSDNFSEYFAEQFRQWYVGKKLTPTQFDTIFSKVEKFLQKLIDKLKGGEYIDESLVKYFEKISNAKDAAKTETAPAETSKADKEIKSLQDEIEQYEREIEDATEEIENTKYNYREAVDEIKSEKRELASSSLGREEKSERKEELDARLEEAAEERDDYIEQYRETIADAKREIKKLQKQIDKLSVKTKAQISGERVSANAVPGSKVWSLIESITPNEKDIPSLSKTSISNRDYVLNENFDLESLLDSDKDFKEYYDSAIESGEFRYDTDEVSPEGLNNPIVVVDGEIRDGYSRATTLLSNGESTASAYVALPKVTTKAQISGERVAPFLKSDPTYKYQMSGTEASLKLIDNIRSKYNMQHTAEEKGIVSKGIRATEKIISDNVVTRALGRVSAVTYKGITNERANKFLGKPLAVAQKFLSDNVRKGLSSQNAAAANASAITVGLIQNLGSTEGFQAARNKLVGGKSVAQNQLWQLGKDLNEMINNDKLALRRVHSLLDPEAFEGITDPSLPDSKADLSFAELRLFNTLRDMNDYIHEWHYQNGFLGEGQAADALYQKNKGSYFARMYNEIENEKFEDLYDALAKLPNAADFSMFKERKNFADVTENLTLKEDPIYITTKRFGQMMQNQAILQFCDYVAKSKDYQIYKNKEDIPAGSLSNYRQLMPKKGGGKVYGELTGKFVPDIVAQQLVGIEFSNQIINFTYQAAKVFDKSFIRQVLSKAKTTWNPLTRAGNITMNFVFASLAGVDPITLLKNRPAAKESLESYDSYARDLDENGLLGVSMGKELSNEKDAKAQAALREGLGLKPKSTSTQQEEAPKSKLAILSAATKRMIKETDQMLTDSYGKSDDVAKVALYKSLVDDYGKTREEAIKVVASSMQNYNTVGKAYDYASKSVNRFVKFKADSARILFNTFKERPLNLMATLGMYLAAQALASKMSGEDEEERKIREQRPYTNKIKIGPVTISLTMKFGDTEINVARYLAPYSMYDAGYNNNTLKEITTMLPLQYDENTFIAVNDPLIGPIINLINDKDFRGMPISDPGKTPFINKTVTDEEARWNRLAFAARNYGAPYYGWYENIMAAATGDKDYYGRSRTLSDALLNTVIKVQKVDNESLQRTYEGALRKLDRDVDNAGKTISHKRNEMNKAIDGAYAEGNKSQEQIDKFITKEEGRFLDFQLEQLDFIEKQRIEMEKVINTRNRLIEIQQRKQQ